MNAGQTVTLASIRDHYRAQKSALLEKTGTGGTSTRAVRAVLHQLSQLSDDTFKALWKLAGFDSSLTLVAVGGYGRGELFPYSDIDVLLLLPDGQSPEQDADLKTRIETFITSCWDAGLEIGSSVRTLSQCLAESDKDVTVQTSMLESRLVTGDARLFARLREELQRSLNPQAFFVAKTLEMRQRHIKFEDTPYALEPNCKESPGGLRDLQVILWVACGRTPRDRSMAPRAR